MKVDRNIIKCDLSSTHLPNCNLIPAYQSKITFPSYEHEPTCLQWMLKVSSKLQLFVFPPKLGVVRFSN